MISYFDTIAAAATPPGAGGIAVIRVSGGQSGEIVGKIFRGNALVNKNLNYGKIFDGGELIDEVLVGVMLAPASYTREDVYEINCHGGPVAARRVLETVLKNGARLADPGEFTKRAFLNGRIDLSRAEAVADIIAAETDAAHKIGVEQLNGKLCGEIKDICAELLAVEAKIEASIDYPEHDLEEANVSEIKSVSARIKNKLDYLIKTFESGRILARGIKTVIMGKPNAGKSSLLNCLLNAERAIVTNVPGTTRDVVSERVDIGGVLLNLHDTAGLRDAGDLDLIEEIGIKKTLQTAQTADLILFMADASDENFDPPVFNQNVIYIVNKIDLNPNIQTDALKISIKENIGLENLKSKIKEMFYAGEIMENNAAIITNARHKDALVKASDSLAGVLAAAGAGAAEDFLSIDLRAAREFLGEITGETLDVDIIDKIFSEFCVGK